MAPILVILVALISTTELQAAVVTVTNLSDAGDSVCDADCTLREAIAYASSGDTIVFARGLRGGIIQLTETLLIDKRLTIDGPNRRRITVKGNQTFRIFHVKVPGSGRVVTIDGLIISDGYESAGDGGGIYVDPTLQATLNITNCSIINNTAQRGGGISTFFGTLYLIDSTVANNTATAENGAGGVDAFRTMVRIMNSTISGNQSTSPVDGAGGVRLTGSDGWFINGSTIAYNSSNGSSLTSAGGLVALNGNPGPVTNTILAKNSGINPDYYGRSSGATNSLIGITDERSGFINGINGNIVGSMKNPINLPLGPLVDNGGGLQTHALLTGTLAVNAGNNSLSIDRFGAPLRTDQRGYTRVVNSVVDMGSFEFGSQPEPTFSTITGQVTNAQGRGVSGARVSLRRPGQEARTATTNPFGYYRFNNVTSNIIYTLECFDKRNRFSSQEILIEESTEVVFTVALP